MFRPIPAVAVLAALLAAAPAYSAEPPKPRAAEVAPMSERSLLTRVVTAGSALVAVGARGHVLRSEDGTAWTQVAAPVDALLTSVFFADARNGWAVGHDASILHSADGGRNWKLQNFQPELNLALLDVLFLDAQHGLAVGAYGLMLETRDGGAHWARLDTPLTQEGLHFNALTRLGDGSLLVVGEEGMMALSRDAGATWERLASPYESSLFAVLAAGPSGAVVAGLRGNAYRSDDVATGAWQRLDTGSVQSVFGLAPMPGGRVGMAGLNGFLEVVDSAGRIQPLDWHRAGAPTAVAGHELGAFSHLLAWRGDLLTVGDSGVQRWSPGAP